jgi:hypothetical protein
MLEKKKRILEYQRFNRGQAIPVPEGSACAIEHSMKTTQSPGSDGIRGVLTSEEKAMLT